MGISPPKSGARWACRTSRRLAISVSIQRLMNLGSDTDALQSRRTQALAAASASTTHNMPGLHNVDLSKGLILVLTGAAVSAESGIPTFRGKDGYWRNLDPAKLATPEAFERDPKLVWEWYRERRAAIRAAVPN